MTEALEDTQVEPVKKKKTKEKKRPSDFEIVRTIFQRTSDRKLCYILKNLGEDPDIYFLCSASEKEFTYGSPRLAVALIQITDPELQKAVDAVTDKMKGFNNSKPFHGFIHLRDQISELGKTKGESLEGDIHTNRKGSSWIEKEDPSGKKKVQYYSLAIDSLYHVQMVSSYCRSYRRLLDADSDEFIYYPYSHTDAQTSSIMTLLPQHNHPLTQLYPHGFRAMVTKGLDVILDKSLDDFVYPIIDQELIVFHDTDAQVVQIAHRIKAKGWNMVLVRPNAVFFPTLKTSLPVTESHDL